MQQVNFETSMINIPLGGKKEYVKHLTQSIRKVVYAESKDLLYFVMARVINREIGIDCNKTSVRLRTLTMRPVAPRRAGAQLRRDAGGGNM